jgi:hypothetical protein
VRVTLYRPVSLDEYRASLRLALATTRLPQRR